jgi:hypothetical protein
VFKVRNAVITVAVIGAALAFAGCSDSTHWSQETLKLIEPGGKTGTNGVIGHFTRQGLTPGNGFAFSSPLQDPSSKKTVGRLRAFCIATEPSSGDTISGTCSGTAQAPGGGLALNVGGKIGNNVTGSIVGGTGKYAGATGTFSSVSQGKGNGNTPMTDTFNITLP